MSEIIINKPFAAVHNNLEVRFASASGGVFSALAKKAFLQKYHVAGAVWNDDWTASHILTSNKKDLERLRGLKPVMSDAESVFPEVKSKIEEGEKVLFCGTPCQIGLLLSYLNGSPENLLTVSVACQRVIDTDSWKRFLESKGSEHQSPIKDVHYLNKEISDGVSVVKLTYANGEVEYADITRWGQDYSVCDPCKNSDNNNSQIKADISLKRQACDSGKTKLLNNRLGISIVSCNTQKGVQFFDAAVQKYITCQTIDETIASRTLTNIIPLTPRCGCDSSKWRNIADFCYRISKCSRWHLGTLFQNLYYNIFSKQVETSIARGHFLVLFPHCILELEKTSKILVGGKVFIGNTVHRYEPSYTKIQLRHGALLDIQGPYSFGAGSDIQVFDNAIFTIEGGGDTNMNVEIVCGQNLTFQKFVFLGRNVVIRDTNGEHYINRQGYKTGKSVVIGTHAWICDRSVVMPGVTIGAGGIVGANTHVVSDVPANTMVSGNPAKTVDEEVFWKA